ncbi:hypothetical protein L6164_021994 [Bauhinia variegata]|uniref:Uncharacterized protein n=1 Tax=Bauhinia variegata TaxID=167791 RepID=A0ACB9ME80_BAUVA|nr:hypothetical protein L6164_021994 [Bauhinia variegata]
MGCRKVIKRVLCWKFSYVQSYIGAEYMANHMHSCRKAKDDGNNKGRYGVEKGPVNTGFTEFDTTGLRKSARETWLRKAVPNNPSTRKSERLEKMSAPSAAVRRKSEMVEKEISSPLRRSERTKGHVSSTSNELSGSSDSKQKKQKKEKSAKQLMTSEAKEFSLNEENVDGTSQVKNHSRDARAYRASFYKKALLPSFDAKVQEMRASSSLIEPVKEPLENNSGVELCNTRWTCNLGGAHELEGGDCVELSKSGTFKRKRVDHDPIIQEGLSCSTKSNQESVNPSSTKDRVEIEASLTAGIAERGVDYMQKKESSANFQTDNDEKICLICKRGGQLLCCYGKGCKRCYHPSCLEPPMVDVLLGVWHCHVCVRKKIKSGVYSVSEGVESIWDVKEVEVLSVDGLTTQKQFFVKYKSLAHIHNRWVPENQLLLEAPSMITKFNERVQAPVWNPDWSLPHRLLLKRTSISSKQHDGNSTDHGNSDFECHDEWLVKWRGLGYEDTTWELGNSSFLGSTEGQILIRDYEDRRQRAKRISLLSKVDKKTGRGSYFSKLSQVSGGFASVFDNNNLDTVNKLREHWHKGQNSIVIDDQDRIGKVVAFISSLRTDACRPFLIISTSAGLFSWEDQFSRLAPSINVVVYSGNKDVRNIIRRLEFYEEGGCILFEVLIVVPEILVEDLEVLRGIQWEVVIVDESQYSRISYLKEIKLLDTDMRLLLLNGPLKDSIAEYLNIMDLLYCETDKEKDDGLISNSNENITQLKDRLPSYISCRYKSDSVRFVEYLLPVQISNVQLEQYCATLLSNSSVLGSSRKDIVEALRDILMLIRKCCNHPYIVEPSLQTLITEGLKEAEYLDVGIRASGKLQLLDLMLTELKKQGLRGLILFQSIGISGRLGDILDDFLRQRFGPDSYERIDKVVPQPKKVTALNFFNNKDNGRFVFLLEACACSPIIKLSSVDTVIIFDSDWNPMNDIRSLQKISLNSQFQCIKVFRLYSPLTVEEKALIFAKQDKALDSNVQNISRSTCHMLLMWGASCLFDELKHFHNDNSSGSSLNSSSGLSLLKEAVQEFSRILQQDGEDNEKNNSSNLLKIQHSGGFYHTNFSLLGEPKIQPMDEGLYQMFWTKLFERKHPQWKYLCGSPQRSRKRVQHFGSSINKPDIETDNILKKRRKITNNVVDQPSSKSKGEGKISTGNREERPAANNVESDKVRKLRDEQRSLHLLLKPETSKLCEILHLPDNVKIMVENLLEYVMNNHHVHREPVSILQAFQISVCWTAASLLKHKIDHKASVVLAKQHLNFDCKKEEVDYICSMLRCLKKMFLYHTGNSDVAGLPKASELSNKLHSCTGVAPQVELAEKDISKSIKEIQKKCQKQLTKLCLRQQEEKDKLNAINKKRRAEEEHKYKIESAAIRSLTPNDVIRKKKLKDLDAKYARIIEDLKCEHEIHLKDLEAAQLAARQLVQDREDTWVKQVRSWAQIELLSLLPSKKPGNGVEYLQTSEQAPAQSCQKNVSLVSEVASWQISDKMGQTMPRNGIGLSETPATISPVAVPYSNPVEVQTPLDNNVNAKEMETTVPEGESISRNEDHNRAENTSDSHGDIVSLHSYSKEQNSDGGTIMADEREVDEERIDRATVSGMPGTENLSNIPDNVVPANPPSSVEQISDEGVVNVLDSELSSRLHKTSCPSDGPDTVSLFNPLSSEQQIPDGVSISIADVGVPDEVPETGDEVIECHSDREHQTDLDKTTTSDQQEGLSRTRTANESMSQATPALSSSLLQPLVVPSQATAISANEAVQDACTSSPASSGAVDEAATAGEMQNSSQQVGPVWCAVDVVSANQFNHESLVMEPPEEGQQLPFVEYPSSGVDPSNLPSATGIEHEPINEGIHSGFVPQESMEASNQAVVQPASNHESLVIEPQEQGQLLPSMDQDLSNLPSATRIEHQPIREDDHSGCVPQETSNQAFVQPASNYESLVIELQEQGQILPSAEHPSNQDLSNLPLATRIEHQPISEDDHSGCVPQESIEASNQAVVQPASNNESLGIESREQGQLLPSAEQPSNQDLPNLPLANRIEHQPISEDNNLSRQAISTSTEVPNQAVLQPASNSELDSYTPVGGFRILSSDTRNMSIPMEYNSHPTQVASQSVSRTAPPLSRDPLQNEMERIRKETEQTIKFYADMKLRLKSDFEKEMEELRRKYDNKFHDLEVQFQQRKKSLETNLNIVVMNKILAEAFRSKCMDLKVSDASGMQQDASFARQLDQLSRQQTGIRPSLVAGPSSCGPPVASLLSTTTASCSQTIVSTSLAAYDTSAIFSNVSTRPPLINSISPSSGNLQVSSEIRAPAPHLHPYRLSTPMPATGVPTLPNGMPIQQAPANIAAIPPSFPQLRPPRPTLPTSQCPSNIAPTPPSFPQLRPRPTPPTNQSDPHNRGHRSDRADGLRTANLSSMELTLDAIAKSQSGTNLSNTPRLSDGVTLNRSHFGTSDSGTQVNSVHQGTSPDIVCLSDDD